MPVSLGVITSKTLRNLHQCMDTKKTNTQKEYLVGLTTELQYFERKVERQSNKIKIILYPALMAFALLAAYGFYLIQSLTTDVNKMSASVVKMSDAISRNMNSISVTANDMSGSVGKMVGNIHSMSRSSRGIANNMGEMTITVEALRAPMDDMNASTSHMQHDVRGLNQSISKPLGMFNRFIP